MWSKVVAAMIMIPQPFLRTFYNPPSMIQSHRIIDNHFVGCWIDQDRNLVIMNKPHLDPSKFPDAMDSMRPLITAEPDILKTRIPVGFYPEMIEPLDRSSAIISGIEGTTGERTVRIFRSGWVRIDTRETLQAASIRSVSPDTALMTDYGGSISVIDISRMEAVRQIRTDMTTLDACPDETGDLMAMVGVGGLVSVNITSEHMDHIGLGNHTMAGVSFGRDEVAVLLRDGRVCVLDDTGKITWCESDFPLDRPFMTTSIFHVAQIRDTTALFLRLREKWRTRSSVSLAVVSHRGQWTARDGVIVSFGNSMIEAWDLHQEFFRLMNGKRIDDMVAPTISDTECIWQRFGLRISKDNNVYHEMNDWMRN